MTHIIPIGPNCNVAITLRVMKVRNVSYPWDWIRDSTIEDVIDVIKKGPEFDVKTWNNFSNIEYFMPHDFGGDSHNADELLFEGGDLLNKYRRRFRRFFEHITDGTPVYFLRYGHANKASIDELQQLLPSSKIIHIEDGHPDSVVTHKIIYTATGSVPDPYFRIIESIVHMLNGITPYSSDHRIKFPVDSETIIKFSLEMKLSEITDYISRVFPDKRRLFSDKVELYNYVRDTVKELSGVDYALL